MHNNQRLVESEILFCKQSDKILLLKTEIFISLQSSKWISTENLMNLKLKQKSFFFVSLILEPKCHAYTHRECVRKQIGVCAWAANVFFLISLTFCFVQNAIDRKKHIIVSSKKTRFVFLSFDRLSLGRTCVRIQTKCVISRGDLLHFILTAEISYFSNRQICWTQSAGTH